MFNRHESPDKTPDSIGASTGQSSSLEDSGAADPHTRATDSGRDHVPAGAAVGTPMGSHAGDPAEAHRNATDSTLEKDPADDAPQAAWKKHRQHPMLLADEAARWLGLEVVEFGPGHATCTMVLRPEMLNGHGIGHGGMIFSLADTTFAIACNDADATDTITVAAGVDINFLAPALPGRVLTAKAVQRSSTGRSGLYDVTVTQDEGLSEPTLIAEFRGRSRTIPRR